MNFFNGDSKTSISRTIYVASDHAGFDMKTNIVEFLRDEFECKVIDCGAEERVPGDDYPIYIAVAARKVAEDPENSMGIIFGGSGQGEAMVANRFKGVRAAVYYGSSGSVQNDATGNDLDILASARIHNNSNVLSLGARFLDIKEAKEAVKKWVLTDYPHEKHHERRIRAIDDLT